MLSKPKAGTIRAATEQEGARDLYNTRQPVLDLSKTKPTLQGTVP
jgi:hypothetical protein